MTSKFEIEKVKQEIKVLEKKLALLEEMQNYKSPVEKAYKDWWGQYPSTEKSISETEDMRWAGFQAGFQAAYEEKVREDNYYDEVIEQKNEPYYPDEPDWYDEVEWDRKDNPKLQRVIDKMVEERNSKKLRNMLKVQLDYDGMVCDDIVDIVEDWLPKEQSTSGSQDTFVEIIVEGYNDCVKEMKEMLR